MICARKLKTVIMQPINQLPQTLNNIKFYNCTKDNFALFLNITTKPKDLNLC